MASIPLRVDDLTIGYPGSVVATDISFSLNAGSMTALMGPNGSGKSTLIKSILGLTPAQAGQVRFFGERLNRVRPRVAYVPQRSSVDLNFPITAYDTVLLGTYPRRGFGRRVRRQDKDAAAAALERIGLSHLSTARIGTLSGGQLQRVFLARALVQKAELVILDEPLTGVDYSSEQIIVEQLQELAMADTAVLVVHHDLSTARDYFDHILLLDHSIIANGPSDEVTGSLRWQELFGTTSRKAHPHRTREDAAAR